MTINVKDGLADISVADRRQEWEKVETEFSTLKQQLVRIAGIDHTQDMTQIRSLFENDVHKIFMDAQKHVLTELKDHVPLDVTDQPTANNTIRREAVRLPTFEGNEETSTPFLTFPIWKKQWETMIVDYPERFRAIMLRDHVDECARAQFIGYETDYEEAMKHLTRYYGDKHKVVTCVMQEVMNQSEIKEAEYKELIKYSVNLQSNFARLKAVGLEKDMSGTLSMIAFLRKFPRSVGEKWHEHLSEQTTHLQENPFPVFIDWLKSQREIWERMAAVDTGRLGSADGHRDEMAHFGTPTCYNCD
jgi:hypothetical protein